jgi:hypothetical protein
VAVDGGRGDGVDEGRGVGIDEGTIVGVSPMVQPTIHVTVITENNRQIILVAFTFMMSSLSRKSLMPWSHMDKLLYPFYYIDDIFQCPFVSCRPKQSPP